MKTWDDCSDFDLSFELAKIVAIDGPVEHNSKSVHILDYHNGVCLGWKTFAINNPADMWSIILENNIVITPCMGANIGDATGYSEHQNPIISEFNDNSKALRAAAIVFLMMNGVNPE